MALLITCTLAVVACARGWFPWAILLLAAPYLLPAGQDFLATCGFDPLERIGDAQVALPLGPLSMFGLAGMSLMGRD